MDAPLAWHPVDEETQNKWAHEPGSNNTVVLFAMNHKGTDVIGKVDAHNHERIKGRRWFLTRKHKKGISVRLCP